MLCIRLLCSEKPLYEQGFIVAPHLGTLGFSIGRGVDFTSIYLLDHQGIG